jgi:hypothetical protein
VIESRASFGQRVDVRGFIVVCTVAADFCEAEIICQNEDDVWPVYRSGSFRVTVCDD